jgi:diaminopimelate epimerase
MEFAKLHGLGNDFLIARADDPAIAHGAMGALARTICHRRCGVGADGMLFFRETVGDAEADYSTLIFNADGSRAEMSGNGVRCLAAFLYHAGRSAPLVRIRTVAGIRTLVLKGREKNTYVFDLGMGQPILDSSKIGVGLPAQSPVIDYPLDVGGETVKITVTSMGNPHCSTFWADLEQAPIDSLGPRLESHPIFPSRTNVEFIQPLDAGRIRVRFWERGVGRTLASGTGSSAAAVAAILHGVAASPLTVETELGELQVRWTPGTELSLTGPAQFVCSGEYLPEADL